MRASQQMLRQCAVEAARKLLDVFVCFHPGSLLRVRDACGWPARLSGQLPPDIEPRKRTTVGALSRVEHGALVWGAASGAVPAREGVLRLMDETQAAGLALGVCSAATKSSAVCVLESLLGQERFQARLYLNYFSMDLSMLSTHQDKPHTTCCFGPISCLPCLTRRVGARAWIYFWAAMTSSGKSPTRPYT